MTNYVNPDDFAIVIGINCYEDPERNLTSPVHDANRLKDWLVDPTGGGLDPKNCKVLLGENTTEINRKVIEDELIAARHFSKKRIENGGAARRLYFYFSGHGLAKQVDEVLMCHSLWSGDRPNANINSSSLEKGYLNNCTWFEEVVVWLDCCRNRSIITKPSTLEVGCAPRDDGGSQKTMLAYATLDGSYAYEGLTENDDGNSVFTEALLTGLRIATNGSGIVSWRSLKRYLEEFVPEIAKAQQKAQTPQVDFLRLPSEQDPGFNTAKLPTVTLTFDIDSGIVFILDREFSEIVPGHDLAQGPINHPFPPGRYLAINNNRRQPFSISGTEQSLKVNFNG